MNKFLFYCFLILALASCINRSEEKSGTDMEINQNWEFRQIGEENWLPAIVPGTVHTDLLANKVIEDPFYRLNEKHLHWIDKADWEYRKVFSADDQLLKKERQELIFEGLDTYAKIYLNGELIQETDNMFRTWTIDVTHKIKKGENKLSVVLESPTRKGLEELKAYGFQLPADNDQSETGEMGSDRVSPYVRKAPYHFGWDWGPRLVTSGIWRPVTLRAWSDGRIEDVNIVINNLSEREAALSANIELVVAKSGEYSVRISWRDSIPMDSIPIDLKPGINSIEIPISINNPKLWQPNGYGEQELYQFHIELLKEQKVVDTKVVSTGLRTVKLVRQPDPDGKGRSFYFEVNGRPVFAKGANYIPNDVFLNRVSPEKYEFIVKSAAEANMNMLRVWGGGIYENDIFYDLCDKYGILVWQDFMFACAMYPGNDEFLENVRQEAIDNVKRLRNHPCIVLWCGNNEIEAAWGPYEENRGWGWKGRYNTERRDIIWKAYDTLFHHILPGVIEEDPGRPYWHSSPSAGMGQLASYETTSGDMHYWGVWQGQTPFSDFRKCRARFMSEYGFQSFPEFSSVKRYAHPESFNIESTVMLAHQRSGIGNPRIRHYMEQDYIVPEDFEASLYISQLVQAEAISLAISSHRCDMSYCMGSLYWQLNDCWPATSWSGIDYYGRWKALHYAAREAFKPVVLVIEETDPGLIDNRLIVHIVADEFPAEKLQVEMKLLTFDGIIKWQAAQDVEITSHSTLFLDKYLEDIFENINPANEVLVSNLIQGDSLIDTDLHYFVKPKELKLLDPLITSEMAYVGDSIEISITAKNLAKNVFLSADVITGHFSDNFFDILPGKTVIVSLPVTNTNIENLKALKVLHLFITENQSK